MTSYLGRGFDDIPGKPFGWAYYQERDEIAAHLRKRGFDESGVLGHNRFDAAISKIQNRIYRNKPGGLERARGRLMQRTATPPIFTNDELTHLIELFNGANDPTSRAIALKAAEMLQCRPS